MDNVTIKKKLYELRIKAGYSQEDIADLLQISLNSYRKIEKGKTRLISDRLQDIAKIYNITTDDLIMEENPGYGNPMYATREAYEKKIRELENDNINLKQLVSLLREKLAALENKKESQKPE